MSRTRDALAPLPTVERRRASGPIARLRRLLGRSPPEPTSPASIDWHGRYVQARAANEVRRATAICRAALQREETVDWWLRLARCQAEREFYVDALDAVRSALDRAGPVGAVREEARRLLGAARRAAAGEHGAAAQRLNAAVARLERRLAG